MPEIVSNHIDTLMPPVLQRIQDQHTAIRILNNSIKNNRISHAYLFWGPDGVGKKFTAKAFAQSVLCQNTETKGCGVCSICSRIERDIHPDVMIIRPMGKTRLIGVDTIEDINKTAQYRPYESNRRFIIFEDAERIGIPAQNHFLKTLEEPVSETTFILLSSNPGLILPTIRSRCQPIRFQRLRLETVTKIINQIKEIPEETASLVAMLSQGQISKSIEILDSDKRTLIMELFKQLAQGRDPLLLTAEFDQFLTGIRKRIEKEVNKSENIDKKELTPAEQNAMQQLINAEIEAQVANEFESCLYLITCFLRDVLVYINTQNSDMLYFPEMISEFPSWNHLQAEAGLNFVEKVRSYLSRNISREKVVRDLFFALSPKI